MSTTSPTPRCSSPPTSRPSSPAPCSMSTVARWSNSESQVLPKGTFMRAAVLNEQKTFDIVDHPDPTPGASDLVLRVEACGICGSDLKAASNMPVGLVMGHEFCGEIVAVGRDAVGSWKVGDR